MKVFLIGATGFIGARVAEKLRNASHEIVGLARSESATSLLHSAGIRSVSGDLREPAGILDQVSAADATIWVAGHRLEGAMTPDEVARVLPRDTYTFIVTTGTGAYADTDDGSVDEDHPLADNQRGRWQASMESSVLEIREGRTIIIRPTWVYGPDRTRPGWLNTMVNRAAEHGVSYLPEHADYEVSTVHVDDLADLYVHALERAPGGSLFNAPSEPPVHVKRLAEAVAVAAGVPGRVEEIPYQSYVDRFGGLGIFSRNMVISQQKSRSLLRWQPASESVIDLLEN